MLLEFGAALRKSKSMTALHLSGNPGDTEEVRLAISKRARVKPFDPTFKPDFKQLNNAEYKDDVKSPRKQFKLE